MDILDWIKRAGDLAVNARNVELQSAVLEIKREVLQLKEENLRLREKVAGLENERVVRQSVKWREPSYYVANPGGSEDGPYCQKCWDADQKLIRQHESTDSIGTTRHCLQCDSVVQVGPVRDYDPYSDLRR